MPQSNLYTTMRSPNSLTVIHDGPVNGTHTTTVSLDNVVAVIFSHKNHCCDVHYAHGAKVFVDFGAPEDDDPMYEMGKRILELAAEGNHSVLKLLFDAKAQVTGEA